MDFPAKSLKRPFMILSIPIFLLLVNVLPLALEAESIKGQSQDSDLTVNLKIISQKYCHNDNVSFSVLMEVRLRFTNKSNNPVILSRWIINPLIVRVAKTPDLGSFGVFEDNAIYEGEVGKPYPHFGGHPDAKKFIVLSPGDSYDTIVQSGVVGKNSPIPEYGMVTKGTHYLQLGISTWAYLTSPREKSDLASAWSHFGKLATGIVYSEYVPFVIPENFSNPRCNEK